MRSPVVLWLLTITWRPEGSRSRLRQVMSKPRTACSTACSPCYVFRSSLSQEHSWLAAYGGQ